MPRLIPDDPLIAAKQLFLSQIDEIVDKIGVPRDYALNIWYCQNFIGLTDDVEVEDAVLIGGKNDYGIDIFHYEDSGEPAEHYVEWGQGKFAEDLDHVGTRNELEALGKTLEYLTSCPTNANSVFKRKSAEFNSLRAVNAHVKKRMVFVLTGELNAQAKELIESPEWKKQMQQLKIEFEVIDLEKILAHVTTPVTPTIRMKFDGGILIRTDSVTHKHSINGYVKAKDLVNIVKKHKRIIFKENPRESLGNSTPTNKAISATLNDPITKQKLWKLNNGITTTCSTFRKINSSSQEFEIDNFKVVNGRQTTHTLENCESLLDDNVIINIIIHEAINPEERNFISQTSNTQNPSKPVDQISNYDEINNMVLQCKYNFSDFYFERQTKGFNSEKKSTKNRVTRRRVLGKNDTARAYYAYALNPVRAMAPDKDFFYVGDSQ